MEVIRTFHPIGQGGFYTETFDDSKNKSMIVFDCGGNSSKSMRDYLDSFISNNPTVTIEAVFISHLHDDHINGLQHLLDRANVKKIFLPQFNTNRLFDIFFYNAANGARTDDSNNLVLSLINPTNTFGETQIIQVEETNGDISYREDANHMHQVSQTIASGTPLKLENEWIYIPFNPKSKTPNFDRIKDQSIKEILQGLYNNATNPHEQAEALAKFVKLHGVKKCKELYKDMFGNIHNGQSMTLFSGLRKSEYHKIRCYPLHSPFNHFYRYLWRDYLYEFKNYNENCILTNFLYTGDYESGDSAKMKELSSFYTKMQVWETICGVQIPHHGSRNNYADELYNKRCYAIASAGSSNRFHHPNIDTLINIFHQRCMPFVVTEAKNTIIMQEFNI